MHRIHLVLLLLVEHMASMKIFQALQSPPLPLTLFHDLPVFLISSSIVLRHVLFGLPPFLYPWWFQCNAVYYTAPVSLRNVYPIQFHFVLFIWVSIGFCLMILYNSSFLILSVNFIFIIRLMHCITFLKFEIFRISKHIWSQELRDFGPVPHKILLMSLVPW